MDLKLKQEASIKGSKRLVITICLLILAFAFVLHLWKVYTRVTRPEKVAPGIARLSKIYRIYEIKTDPFEDRFVWAATDAGLAQYNKDNGAMRLFGYQDSIPSETVSSVLPLEDAIWAGHWWGLSRLDRKDYKVTNLTQQDGLASKRIFTLAADKGLIYAGGDEGITVLDNAFTIKGKITKASGLIGREVYSLKIYQDQLYAGHEAGRVSIYHLKDKKVRGITSDRADKKTVIGDILKDGNSLWIATSNAGVWSYHLKTGQIAYHVPTTGFPAKGAYAVEKIDGDIWCGTSFGIARKFGNTSSWILLRDERQANEGIFQIMALTGDAGYVWYGAADVGIGKYFKEKIEWLPLSGSMTHDHIQAIGVVGNQVYLGFGYLGDCVDVIDRETLAFMKNMKPWEGISLQRITRIHADLDYIYFCGFSGLSFKHRKSNTWTLLGQSSNMPIAEVTDIVRFQGDVLYLGTSLGLKKYSLQSNTLLDLGAQMDDNITSMAMQDHTLYLGTLHSGIVQYDLQKKEFNPGEILKNERIDKFTLYQNEIWANVFGKGLVVVNRDGMPIKRSLFSKTDKEIEKEFQGSTISEICLIDNRLWIGTKKNGIFIYIPETSTWRRLTFRNGLINNEILTICDDKDYIWIGLFGGLNRIEKKLFYKDFLTNESKLKGNE